MKHRFVQLVRSLSLLALLSLCIIPLAAAQDATADPAAEPSTSAEPTTAQAPADTQPAETDPAVAAPVEEQTPAAEGTSPPAEPPAVEEAVPAPAGQGGPGTPTNVQASDRARGVNADEMVVITWDGDGDYYRVFRSESADGPWAQIGGNVNGTEYRDYEVERDNLYYYRVQAFIIRGGESAMSEPDAGRADLSNREFFELALATERSAHRRLREAEPEPGIGTDVTVRGARGGTVRWVITRGFLEGHCIFEFDDYNEFGLIANGSTGGDISMFKNGDNDGTLEFSGDYEGTAIWNVEVRDGDGAGGGFMVIYPAGTRPVWIPWSSLDLEPLPEVTPREEE